MLRIQCSHALWLTLFLRTLTASTVRLDVRDKASGAALSMVFQQHGQTLAALAVANPKEHAHSAPGAALLDTLLPAFVCPAPAVPATPTN